MSEPISAIGRGQEVSPDTLEQIQQDAEACRACPLGSTRQHVVIVEIHGDPRVLFIGQSPGATEDATGKPFQGMAGAVLRERIQAIGLVNYAIINVINCYPTGNTYQHDYAVACRPFFERKLRLLKPTVVVLLGLDATTAWWEQDPETKYPTVRRVVSTYHPSYINRSGGPKHVTDKWLRQWDNVRQTLDDVFGVQNDSEGSDHQ